MRKILRVTYCTWKSYGSILQTLGLQKALEELGFENAIINKSETYKKTSLSTKYGIKGVIKFFFDYPLKKKEKSLFLKNRQFINSKINSVNINKDDDYKKLANDADLFLAGSDQIWHPDVLNPTFFLDFVPQGVKRISYAASMGKTDLSNEARKKMSIYLSKFHNISVREEENKRVLSKITDKNIEVNIDPTFLLEKDEWEKYCKPLKIKDYILVFPIYWDKNFNKQLKLLHKKTGKKIVLISSGRRNIYKNKQIFDADVSEFLSLIKNADMVVTSSFHGLAMSIIFNKPFTAVINPDMPSRLENLLKICQAKNFSMKDYIDGKSNDYDKINDKIIELRQQSLDYLKGVLE